MTIDKVYWKLLLLIYFITSYHLKVFYNIYICLIIMIIIQGVPKKNVPHAKIFNAMFPSPNLKILLHTHLYDPNLDLCPFLARSGEKNFWQKIWKSSFWHFPDIRFRRRSESSIRKICPTCVQSFKILTWREVQILEIPVSQSFPEKWSKTMVLNIQFI